MSTQLDAVRRFMASSGRGATTAPRAARVIAVGSGKGGVGTSTVAALLAASMANASRSVLLVDAHEQLGALHLVLGVDPAHAGAGHGRGEPEELLVPVAPSLTLLPGSLAVDGASRSPAERRLRFRRAVSLYERFDLVVIDAGSTLDTMLAVCADGVGRFLAVTAGDRIAMVATYALIKALRARHPSLDIEVLANRIDADTARRGIEHVRAASEHFLEYTVGHAGTVPDDPDFASAIAAGMGAHEAAEGSAAASALRDLGERIMSQLVTTSSAPRTSALPSSTRLRNRG